MNYNYVYSLLNKLWVNTEEIQKLCNCSRNSAMTIRREVEKMVEDSGKRLPTARHKVVPTMMLLDYLGIDVNTVLNITLKENELLEVSK